MDEQRIKRILTITI